MGNLRSFVQFANREDAEQKAKQLAASLQLPYIALTNQALQSDTLHLIPKEMGDRLLVVTVQKQNRQLTVASPTPTNPELQTFLLELAKNTGLKIILAVCSMSSYLYGKKLYEMSEAHSPEAESQHGQATMRKPAEAFRDKQAIAERLMNVSTTEALDILFAGALSLRASDIHLEPTKTGFVVRFRIDGVLQQIGRELPAALYKAIRSRIKFLANLKLDVTDRPQDGRFEFKAGDRTLDVRVSALPTPYGEAFVMRLLTVGSATIKLDQLGFTPEQTKVIRTAINQPNGLILNTGPTGSGKTTTLYAILSELNKPGVKIITVEDPIEYTIKGVQQSQIEPEKGYNFATALKSVVRQDPDIIMVGEIRDAETAEIAVQAALTGHLVLSTLHTNSAAGSIPRLLDMGIKTYLLSGVINLIIAQRLVRRLAHPEKTGDERYEGRIAIAELLVPNHEIETLIQQKASIDQFNQAAEAAGMTSLYSDGIAKAKAGITTKEEVERVASDDNA